MTQNSPETPQVKHNSWQQMHDGLFWPRYAPLLPGRPESGSRTYGPHELIAATHILERLVEYLSKRRERPE